MKTVSRRDVASIRRDKALRLVVSFVRYGKWYATEVLNGVGVHSQGRTMAEARNNIIDAAVGIYEVAPRQIGFCRCKRKPVGAHTEKIFVVIRSA